MSKATVVVSQFARDVYALATTSQKAVESAATKMCALVGTHYGDTSPTFEQYGAVRAELLAHAKARKGSEQNARKRFAAAIVTRYGKLPVSMTPDAVIKRAQREASEAAKKANPAPVGAPAGQTQDRAPSESETTEAIVTRIGWFKCLEAISHILAADDLTKGQAIQLEKIAQATAAKLAKKAA